jgi:hypothetical protein
MAKKMFRVRMTAKAFVLGSLLVSAKSEQEARDKAATRLGDVSWRYQELDCLVDEETEVSPQ